MNRALAALVAGAVGTTAPNVATYVDVAGRGRLPSELPAKAAGQLSERIGVPLLPGRYGAHRPAALGRPG